MKINVWRKFRVGDVIQSKAEWADAWSFGDEKYIIKSRIPLELGGFYFILLDLRGEECEYNGLFIEERCELA